MPEGPHLFSIIEISMALSLCHTVPINVAEMRAYSNFAKKNGFKRFVELRAYGNYAMTY